MAGSGEPSQEAVLSVSPRPLEQVSFPCRDLWHLPRWAWWVTMEC